MRSNCIAVYFRGTTYLQTPFLGMIPMVTLSVRGTGAVRIGGPPPQRRVVLKWFYSLSRRNTFVGGTCAPPSSLLFVVLRSTNSKSGAKRHPQHLRRPANRNSLLKTITWAKHYLLGRVRFQGCCLHQRQCYILTCEMCSGRSHL